MIDANHFFKYRRRETLISACVNMAFSAIFYFIVFGAIEAVPVRGLGNFAFDFLPQSAAIGLMGSLIPGLLMRRALAQGSLPGAKGHVDSRALLKIVGRGILAAVGIGILLLLAFWIVGPDKIDATTALIQKLAYGALLGGMTTRLTLSSAIVSITPPNE